jgi:hypothetical protein
LQPRFRHDFLCHTHKAGSIRSLGSQSDDAALGIGNSSRHGAKPPSFRRLKTLKNDFHPRSPIFAPLRSFDFAQDMLLREIFRDFGCGSVAAASCENRRFQLLKMGDESLHRSHAYQDSA